MSDGKDIRAFLAIDPPDAVHDEMARIQERLKKTVLGTISWTRPTGMHLTLKFFGDIAQDDIGPISDVIESRIAGIEPFDLVIKGLGVFPNARRPRVLWMGTVGDVERLAILQKNLDPGFADLGFEREDRPFRAHWTLARIKSPEGLTGLPRALEWGENASAGAFQAGALILYKSELKPQGAVYTKLAEFTLKG